MRAPRPLPRPVLPLAFLALLLAAALPPAHAQAALGGDQYHYQGGVPGTVSIVLQDVDLAGATTLGGAVEVDPSQPVRVSITLTPPEGVTWNLSGMRVGLLLAGTAPSYERFVEGRAMVPPGYTVVINRTVDLAGVKALGAGVFRMQVAMVDDRGGVLHAQPFYLHVEGNPVLTATGAVVTAASAATGYGLWRLVQDVRELKDAHKRHRRRKLEEVRLAEKGVVGAAKETLRERDRLERRPHLRWTLTGTGLGAVALSWAQFLGYAAFDAMTLLLASLGTAGTFLGLSVLVVAVHRKVAKPVAERVRTVPIQGPDAERTPEAPAAEAVDAEARGR